VKVSLCFVFLFGQILVWEGYPFLKVCFGASTLTGTGANKRNGIHNAGEKDTIHMERKHLDRNTNGARQSAAAISDICSVGLWNYIFWALAILPISRSSLYSSFDVLKQATIEQFSFLFPSNRGIHSIQP
jgi:hypothetical protein